MLDHLGINVSDYERSRDFYEQALAPLGLKLLMEPAPGFGGFGGRRRQAVLLDQRPAGADDRERARRVRRRPTGRRWTRSTRRRTKAGGNDNGGPGIREIYHPNYYGAFVLDPDGNNVEAVCHLPLK